MELWIKPKVRRKRCGATRRTLPKEVHQSHKDAAIVKTHETRDKISQSVQNAKEKVNEKIDKFKERRSA